VRTPEGLRKKGPLNAPTDLSRMMIMIMKKACHHRYQYPEAGLSGF
jgi:hypothetical protein